MNKVKAYIEYPDSHHMQNDSSMQWNKCVRYTHLTMLDNAWTLCSYISCTGMP